MDRSGRARFRLDIEDQRLWDGASPVQLTPKAFELLQLFARNPDRLLTRAEIQGNLWRDLHVSEGLVKEYVHDLRGVLEDDARSPRFIETVRGRGYRFVGAIELADGKPPADLFRLAATARPTLAVAPISNLTGREELETFCRCLTNDLVTDFARAPDIVVVGAERKPGVGYRVQGAAQARGDRIIINLHLCRGDDGQVIWADRYESESRDIHELQKRLVGRVVSALSGFEGRIIRSELRLLRRRPVEELDANALYLLALDLFLRSCKADMLKAHDLCRRAVSLDREHARAWLLLGWIEYRIGTERWAPELRHYARSQREFYLNACRANPDDPLAVMETALLRAQEGDLPAARDGLERAVELGRNQSDLLTTVSKYFCMVADEPSRAMQLASESFPFGAHVPEFHYQHLTRVAYFAGDFETGLVAARRGSDVLSVRLFEILCLAQLGRRDELRGMRARFARRYPDFRIAEFASDPPIIGPRARALFASGAERAALA